MRFSDRSIGDRQFSSLTHESVVNSTTVCSLGALYIGMAVFMVAFNKYLINANRFPFAVPMVLLHSGVSSVLALVLLLAKPQLFPSLTSPTEKVRIDRDLVSKLSLIALLFAGALVFTNTAYLHSSMAFLQMMKESNLVIVYGLCLLASMESFSWLKGRVILMILIATTLTIRGEINFSWQGFLIQGIGQIFESVKIVLQAFLLSSVGKKLDVLTFVILVMPLCFFFLTCALLFLMYVHPSNHIRTPLMPDVIAWWPWLLVNGVSAFALNLAVALFMKCSSAVAFILAGIVKDGVIVLAAGFILGEPISPIQAAAFIMQLSLIWLWSMMKFFPDKFDRGLVAGVVSMCSPPEKQGLLDSAFVPDASQAAVDYGASKYQRGGSNQGC